MDDQAASVCLLIFFYQWSRIVGHGEFGLYFCLGSDIDN